MDDWMASILDANTLTSGLTYSIVITSFPFGVSSYS
jgi:hypothetical protein